MGEYTKRYTAQDVDDEEQRLRVLFDSVGFEQAIRQVAEVKANQSAEIRWLYDAFVHPKDLCDENKEN